MADEDTQSAADSASDSDGYASESDASLLDGEGVRERAGASPAADDMSDSGDSDDMSDSGDSDDSGFSDDELPAAGVRRERKYSAADI